MSNDCIFCRIINRELPADILMETDQLVAFKNIHPVREVHWLIVPKVHIASIKQARPSELPAIHQLLEAARQLAEEHQLAGYKLHYNVEPAGGQVIPHVHLHLLAGEVMGDNPNCP